MCHAGPPIDFNDVTKEWAYMLKKTGDVGYKFNLCIIAYARWQGQCGEAVRCPHMPDDEERSPLHFILKPL